MTIGEFLKQLRKNEGYASARSFYSFLESRLSLSFNYSYYTRVESGSVNPSKVMVEEIAGCLKKNLAEELILIWCAEQFPAHRKIFQSGRSSVKKTTGMNSKARPNQHQLTQAQVAVIVSSFPHYQVFLLLTLSRKKVALEQMEELFRFDVKKILNELCAAKLAISDGEVYQQSAIEMRFPKPETKFLKESFKKVEGWNKDLRKSMSFETTKEKFFIRRTSERHFNLLLGFLDQIDSLVRVADDIDESLNDEVFVFEYSLSSGHIPG